MDITKFYEILGLVAEELRGLSEQEVLKKIKSAWKAKCQTHHPDKGGDPEKFREIMHAYKMITDIGYRESQKMKKPSFGDLNVRVNCPVDFLSAFFGKKVIMTYSRPLFNSAFEPVFTDTPEMISVTVDVRAGTLTPSEQVFEKKGSKNVDTGEIGNAHVVIVPQLHPHFKSNGGSMDIVTDEEIPLRICLCGGTHEVETLYGLKTIVVPPGSGPGTKVAIPNCGVAGIGKHIVVITPKHPDKEELKTEKAWKGLKIDWGKEDGPDKEEDDYERAFRRLGNNFFTFNGGR